MEKKILFLDFDGVLFDTLKEVYLVNRNVYKGVDLFDEIDLKEYELYSKYKYLVYNIWMFYYYNPLIFDKIEENKIETQYKSLIQNRNFEKENEFVDNFLKVRKNLVQNHWDFWKNLETPYEFFYGIKRLYEEIHPFIVIISKKNKASIVERFQSYNFNLNKNQIFAKEALELYQSKGEFMEEYMKNNGFAEGIFVDDNINNIKTSKNPKIKNILALWGNPEPNSKGYSQKEAMDEIFNYFKSK